MVQRLTCECIGCGRTWKGDGHADQWICRDHWQALPRIKRQTYYRARRAYKRRPTMDAWRRMNRLWRRLRVMAIERAVGLS